MPRNMSFAMTTPQMKDRTKTVTRRFGWWNLKPGDILCAVEKGMGLKKGEKINRLGYIRVISTRAEKLCDITQADCIKEGFPDYSPGMFMDMLQDHYGCEIYDICNRIEFEHVA